MHLLTNDLLSPRSSADPSRSDPATSITPRSKFTLFPSLPAELRLKIWSFTLPTSRILEISFSPLKNTYVPNTLPPTALSITHESRCHTLESYTYLKLGRKPFSSIPFNPNIDILYISNFAPILQWHLPDLLYNLSTSPSRSILRKVAIDLRVWNECCEAGLLGVLGRMKELKEVSIVVEFGREFKGEIGFIEAPEWRNDLRWVAEMAEREVGEEMGRARGKVRHEDGGRKSEGKDGVVVRCVLLTRGGEQS
jgi:hypothetical protein